MPFLANRSFSRGDLTLFLTDSSGLPQDGYDVRWTVYRKDGTAASGLSVPAVKASTGEYHAPWGCAGAGGCYQIEWRYSASPGAPRQSWRQGFFVLEGSGGCCTRSNAPAGSSPSSECGTFFSGQPLGPGDLCLQVVDDDGVPTQAFLVLWSIVDSCGCPVTQRAQTLCGDALGRYCACWTPGRTGSFKVKWEWMVDEDSPMESSCSPFSVVNPPALISRCGVPVSNFSCCPPSPPPSVIVVKECGNGSEVLPRTVVLISQTLPLAGAFTSQPAFAFPVGIRHMAFYIKYARGATGGYPVLRLMWGNGVEEIASTIINSSFTSFEDRVSSQEMRISDLLGPVPNSDDPEFFMLETSVPGGSITVRLLIAEGGQPGLPGTAEISVTGSS